MSYPSQLFVDTDNAMGSLLGDIDDGFALTALLRSSMNIAAVSSVEGNTSEQEAFSNNLTLANVCGFSGDILHGTDAATEIAHTKVPTRILALGPLTNIAKAVALNPRLHENVQEVIFVASNFNLPLPAWRFFDFNQWKDPAALKTLFDSQLNLTCLPCNVGRKLRVTRDNLRPLPGSIGDFLRRHSSRWFTRALWIKASRSIPLWDLPAALYTLYPEKFKTMDLAARLSFLGQFEYCGDGGARKIKVIVDFDPSELWSAFRLLLTPQGDPNVGHILQSKGSSEVQRD